MRQQDVSRERTETRKTKASQMKYPKSHVLTEHKYSILCKSQLRVGISFCYCYLKWSIQAAADSHNKGSNNPNINCVCVERFCGYT